MMLMLLQRTKFRGFSWEAEGLRTKNDKDLTSFTPVHNEADLIQRALTMTRPHTAKPIGRLSFPGVLEKLCEAWHYFSVSPGKSAAGGGLGRPGARFFAPRVNFCSRLVTYRRNNSWLRGPGAGFAAMDADSPRAVIKSVSVVALKPQGGDYAK
jgi:hypothetical protein